MSGYTTHDFTESLRACEPPIPEDDIKRVVRSWGNGYPTEWAGGFVLEMRDGMFVYVEGWNDYTGWGCQDGATVARWDHMPSDRDIHDGPFESWVNRPAVSMMDEDPADLNRFLGLSPGERDRVRWT